MKRVTGCLANLLLAAGAVALTLLLALAADHALGWLDPGPPFPGFTGLIYPPNLDAQYRTHDYVCEERINALGFRDREVPLEHGVAFRIVAIGDSFTYGWGVDLDKTWVKVLEGNLKKQGINIEVLNLGKPAANPWQYANIAEKVIPLLKPDLVLVGVLAGDDLQQSPDPVRVLAFRVAHCFPHLIRLRNDWEHFRGAPWVLYPQVPKSAEDSRQEWIRIGKDLLGQMSPEQRARFDHLEDEVKKAFFDGALNPWLLAHSTGNPDYFMCTRDANDEELEGKTASLARQLGRLKRAADREKVPVLVLSIPEGFYVNDAAYRNVQRIGFHVDPKMLMSDVPDRAVEQACAQAGLRALTVSQGFRERRHDSGLYFELDRHFSAEGNRLFADLATPAVAEAIAQSPKKQ